MVKSNDRVAFTPGREAHSIGLALAARREELKAVKVFVGTPGYDFGWYDPGWQEAFEIKTLMPTATCQQAVDARLIDLVSGVIIAPFEQLEDSSNADIVLTEISSPDESGFCSFGQSLWNKKRLIEEAKISIAEVNDKLIRTFGNNRIHVEDIDYFVPHVSSGAEPSSGSLAGRQKKEPPAYIKDICGYVSSLIPDRATIQIGVGRTTEPLVKMGLLDGKYDIGYHSQATPPGVISLVRDGVITGKYKNINQGKCTVTSIGGDTKEELEYVHMNPLFELVDVGYLEDIRVISAHDNFVAINSALQIDLLGQVAAESIGERFIAAAGGQTPFTIGAAMSKGGKSLTVMPSTAANGTVSRIKPILDPGTPVTVPRIVTMYVVTEYGIANLWGKSTRDKALELIGIAHPDFRDELRREALRRFWPCSSP